MRSGIQQVAHSVSVHISFVGHILEGAREKPSHTGVPRDERLEIEEQPVDVIVIVASF